MSLMQQGRANLIAYELPTAKFQRMLTRCALLCQAGPRRPRQLRPCCCRSTFAEAFDKLQNHRHRHRTPSARSCASSSLRPRAPSAGSCFCSCSCHRWRPASASSRPSWSSNPRPSSSPEVQTSEKLFCGTSKSIFGTRLELPKGIFQHFAGIFQLSVGIFALEATALGSLRRRRWR